MPDHHHPEVAMDNRPTPAYLRQLADRTGRTFAWPQTKAQASRQIARLEGPGARAAPLARGPARQLGRVMTVTEGGAVMKTVCVIRTRGRARARDR
jgi:hypothetical protein